MSLIKKALAAGSFALLTAQALAAPTNMVTHNRTSVESNAYIAGTPSIYPTKPHSDKTLNWFLVKLACFGHTDSNNNCEAEIFMNSNQPEKFSLGIMRMNLDTGEITPTRIDKGKYHLQVVKSGEVTLTED